MDACFLNYRLKEIDEVIAKGPYSDNWDSLSQYSIPKEYKDIKFGIFFHWGVYSVPENQSEWYSRNMYLPGHANNVFHTEKYGKVTEFGYKDLINLFNGENFNASEWLDLVESSGAKYMIPVGEHHDGFQMYESAISHWNAKEVGPKRDIIKELQEEALKRNIKFGISSHRAEHCFFMEYGVQNESDIQNPEYGHLYWPAMEEAKLDEDPEKLQLFFDDWLVRSCEMVDLFKPKVFYFDWWIEDLRMKEHLKKFLAYYYNKCIEFGYENGVVNYKHDAVPYGIAVRDMERGHFNSIQYDYWQSCTSSAKNSWCYTKQNEFKSSNELILTLIDIVSKNGNLLLNSGPRANGSICKEEKQLFKEIGEWLKINGEAIYGTHPWKVFGEGETNNAAGDFLENHVIDYRPDDFRFTCKSNYIYVFIMNPSTETSFRIKSMGQHKRVLKWWGEIKDVSCLDERVKIDNWERNRNELKVNLNCEIENPIVLRIELI